MRHSQSGSPVWWLSAVLAIPLASCGAMSESDSSAPASAGSGGSSGSRPNSGPGTPGLSPPAVGTGGSSAGTGGAAGAAGLPAPTATAGPSPTPPPANGGDKYRAPGTNPFVMTANDPFSTFAADVDSASYDIFRRDVKLGMLPRPESVRLEEYVNSFNYEYPAPAQGERVPFQVSVAAAAQVFDRPTVLLRVGIQGRKPLPFQKRPANLVFLVDVSGSMSSPDKLPLAQKVLVDTLAVLDPNDKVSIVTYAGDTRVRLAPTPASQRQTIEPVIAGLTSGGSTFGAGGLTLAYQQAQAGFINEGINHVLLVTDGDFNVGPSSTKELVTLIREKRQTGITLTVLGFGAGNLNDDLMESVSNAGNGMYGFIVDEASGQRYVREKMLSTLEHIAKDVKIQVEFNSEAVSAYRLLGYENRAIADTDFRNDGIDAGEIGAGHRVTALYELVPAGGVVPVRTGAPAPVAGAPSTLPREVAATDLVKVKVRWKSVFANDQTPAEELSSVLPRTQVLEGLGKADIDLQWAAAVAAFAEVLKNSPYADLQLLPTISGIVKGQAARDEDRRDFADLFDKALPMITGRPPGVL